MPMEPNTTVDLAGSLSMVTADCLYVLGNKAVSVIPRPRAVESQQKSPRLWSSSAFPNDLEKEESGETQQRVVCLCTGPNPQPWSAFSPPNIFSVGTCNPM